MTQHLENSADLSAVASSYSSDDEDEHLERISQKFHIRLHAANLPKMGVFRGNVAPDTFAVVTSAASSGAIPSIPRPAAATAANGRNISTASSSSTSSVIWGQTEVVYRCRNPQWTASVTLDYVTGSSTFFYVHLFQHCPGNKANHLKSFGTALFHVADLLSTKHFTRVKRLRSEGCVFCRLELVRDSSNLTKTACLQLQALNLIVSGKKMIRPRNNSSKLDTVMEIAKRESAGWMVVHRSAPVKGSANPVYDAVNLNVEDLCGSDLDRHLRISVHAVRANHVKRYMIGMSETTLRHLLSSNSEHTLNDSLDFIINDDISTVSGDFHEDTDVVPERAGQLLLQRSSDKMKEVGRIRVCKASLHSDDGSPVRDLCSEQAKASVVVEIVDLANLVPLDVPKRETTPLRSFSSYIDQGCQIDFCVAIDFTSSNGDPTKEGSYHYIGEDTMNDYEETISAIGQALAKYSESKEYAVWGFGAKFGGEVRHIFQCGPTPTVTGVEGILAAYKYIFQSDLTMSGPTVFEKILQAAAVQAKRNHDVIREKPRYTVLLIITDGIMDNFEETRQRLHVYSFLPLSIVIVGVGRSDFGLMYQLCQPTNTAARCNTTFVEFRRHQHDPTALGEAALRNIPLQLCEYMKTQGI